MAMVIAGAIERRATAEDPAPDLSHAAIDFSRVARAVRLTLALQSKLIGDFKNRSRPADTAEADHGPLEVRWLAPSPPTLAEQKGLVRQGVRRAAQDAGCDTETVERLAQEAGERLENDDIHAELMSRPFEKVVAVICAELGLAPLTSSPVSGSERGSNSILYDRVRRPEGPDGAFRRTNASDGIPLRSP